MPANDEKQFQVLSKAVQDLTGYVATIAKEVYSKSEDDEMYGDTGYDAEAPVDVADVPGTDDADYTEEIAKALAKATAVLRKYNPKALNKGFADSAEATTDEEDAPFDEQQSSIDGNEPSPAGEQGGAREDETFGLAKSIAKLAKQVDALTSGTIVTKSVVPANGTRPNGRGAEPETLTRDMEVAAKQRSWKDLNHLREQVGDLPRNGFTN